MEDFNRRLVLAVDKNDIDAAEKLCESAYQDLLSESASDSEPAPLSFLKSLRHSVRIDHPNIRELLDRCALHFCAPVLLSGLGGAACRQHAENILGVLVEAGPGRDVFTGIVEGVHLFPSECWEDSDSRKLGCTILNHLPTILSRIKRRKQAFLGDSLSLALHLARGLTSSHDNAEVLEQLRIVLLFTRDCPASCGYDSSLDSLPKETSLTIRAFLVQLLRLYLSKLAARMACEEMEEHASEFSEDMLVMIAQFLHGAGWGWTDFEEVDELTTAWMQAVDHANEIETKRAMTISVGFLLWGCFCSDKLAQALRLTVDPNQVLNIAVEMCNVASDDPTVFAGLALVSAVFKTPEFRREISNGPHTDVISRLLKDLVEHMNGNLNVQLRMVCLSTVKSVLEAAEVSMRWSLYQELFACPHPEIAAVLFQDFKSLVVRERQTGSKSRFNSPDVVGVIRDIVSVDRGGWEGVLHASDLLAAALNLYRYLIVNLEQMGNREDELGVLGGDVVGVISKRCRYFRECVEEGVKESKSWEGTDCEAWLLGLERLDEVVTRVQELIE
ncbi:hypothetical protein BSKO_03327 [Bryopsis sp. KO-2023]|nr:hypothetical protein BSKO_03327 [Bryopsis sp. KO-2023]